MGFAALILLTAVTAGVPDPLVVYDNACIKGVVRLGKSTSREIPKSELPHAIANLNLMDGGLERHFAIGQDKPFFLSIAERRDANGEIGRRVCRVAVQGLDSQKAYAAVDQAGVQMPVPDDKVRRPVSSFSRINSQGFVLSFNVIPGRWTILDALQLGANESAKQRTDLQRCRERGRACDPLSTFSGRNR